MQDQEELLEKLKEIESIRGRHTELITVYVPAGFSLLATIKQLEAEKSTAANIKSKSTRNNVIDALEKIVRELKQLKETPPNGLVVFCGNISKKEGTQDLQIFMFEPPLPINVKLYRCDQTFVTSHLMDLISKRDKYGLLVIDRQEATLGILDGKHIEMLSHHTSGVPGKAKTGGSSAARFARVREMLAKDFFNRISDELKKQFGHVSGREIKGLIIGGPGPTKEEFLAEVDIGDLKRKILAIEDIGYADEYGLEVLVEKAQGALQEEEIIKEKKILTEFFTLLGRDPDKVAYGDEVEKALRMGAAEKVLISIKLPSDEIKKIAKLADETGAEVIKISTDTGEGVQFKNLGGKGAFLRFKII